MLENYNDILTIQDLCELLMIGRNHAYKLLESQQIKGFRIGRTWKIPKKAVEEFIMFKCPK